VCEAEVTGFARDTTDILSVLDAQGSDLRRLVSNTGVTFEAITQDEAQLHNLVIGAGRTFDATASQNVALAEAFQIFPTFLDESKRTLARLKTFATDTDPLIRDLRQPTRDLGPTLHSVRLLAPDLRFFFRNLDPLIRVSRTGLPALQDVLTGARPLLGNLGPFLGQLNPILEWLEQNQHTTADFISQGANAVGARITSTTPGGQGHYLRQFGPAGAESLSLFSQRLATNRGNSYLWGDSLANPPGDKFLIFPNFDCRNTGRRPPAGELRRRAAGGPRLLHADPAHRPGRPAGRGRAPPGRGLPRPALAARARRGARGDGARGARRRGRWRSPRTPRR
jgi:phospholipid/cholesterol/gamma-HCH transport system substrate-binding protein